LAKPVVVFGNEFEGFLELLRGASPLGLAGKIAASLKVAAKQIHFGVGFAGTEMVDEAGEGKCEPDCKQEFSHERGLSGWG
jgi:hypothetical protein